MIRRRDTPDGLPFRVYERKGVRTYSIGYKLPTGAWAFRYSCPASDRAKIAELRAQAIGEAALLGHGVCTTGQTEELIAAWFAHQDSLPVSDPNRRAGSPSRHRPPRGSTLRPMTRGATCDHMERWWPVNVRVQAPDTALGR